MPTRDVLPLLAAALTALLGAFVLVFAARANFQTYRTQPSVAILEALPESSGTVAFAFDGNGSTRAQYRLGAATLTLSGWAYDRQTMQPFLAGAVYVDGHHPQRIMYGTTRPAVADHAENPSLVQTGWYVRFPPGSLAPGKHVVSFAFVAADGTRVDRATDVAAIISERFRSKGSTQPIGQK